MARTLSGWISFFRAAAIFFVVGFGNAPSSKSRMQERCLVTVEQIVKLTRNGLELLSQVGRPQDFRGGDEIHFGRWRVAGCAEEEFIEFSLAEIGKQRGKGMDGRIGKHDARGAGFFWQAFDALEQVRLLVADSSYFG